MSWERLNTALLSHIPHLDAAVLAAADNASAVVDERDASHSIGVPAQLEQPRVRHKVPHDDVSVGAAGDCVER
jgi:hypothetical protein